eukprot:357179-Chlamydomonas_euryale.AAC.7
MEKGKACMEVERGGACMAGYKGGACMAGKRDKYCKNNAAKKGGHALGRRWEEPRWACFSPLGDVFGTVGGGGAEERDEQPQGSGGQVTAELTAGD